MSGESWTSSSKPGAAVCHRKRASKWNARRPLVTQDVPAVRRKVRQGNARIARSGRDIRPARKRQTRTVGQRQSPGKTQQTRPAVGGSKARYRRRAGDFDGQAICRADVGCSGRRYRSSSCVSLAVA